MFRTHYDCYSPDDCVFSSEEDCYRSGDCAAPYQSFRVSNVNIHPDYRDMINDLAIITLDSDVSFTNTISPICLPYPEGLIFIFIIVETP